MQTKRFLALSLFVLALNLSACSVLSTKTIAPEVVTSHVVAMGKYSNKQDADMEFAKDGSGVIVYQDRIDEYDVLTKSNAKRPDTIKIGGIAGFGGVTQPNPKKILGLPAGVRFGIVKLPDGRYHMTWHALRIMDRLRANLKSEKKI